MGEHIGRAGMDVAHHPHGKAARGNRSNVLRESARHLDPDWVQHEAARNPNVDPSRTDQNALFVNDGSGGFRETRNVDEVLDYGDERVGRVRRKIAPESRTMTTVVAHLPKSMCEERTWIDPQGKERRYYAPKDDDEARRYFEAFVAYLGKQLAGGPAAIHGYAVNVDEMTPHVQIVADTFGPDPKTTDPRALRQMYHQTWGSHREVRDDQGRQKGGAAKMREYQAGLREHMAAQGFPVELDADPIRSRRKQSKADFVELSNEREALAAQEQQLGARGAELDAFAEELDGEAEETEAKRAQYVELMDKQRRAHAALEASLRTQEQQNAEARRSLEEARRLLEEARQLQPTEAQRLRSAYRHGVAAGGAAAARFVPAVQREALGAAVRAAGVAAPTGPELLRRIEQEPGKRKQRREELRETIAAEAARLDARRSPSDRDRQRD